MKIRNKLVSNSSAASFICVFGRIDNPKLFKRWCLRNDLDNFITIMLKGKNIETTGDMYDSILNPLGDFYEFFSLSKATEEINKAPESYFIFAEDEGPDIDGYWLDVDGGYDFEKAQPSDFPAEIRMLYEASKEENGVTILQKISYAGRDG